MLKLCSLVGLLLFEQSQASTTSVARFNAENTGIEGEISALNGFIWVNLDFSAVNWTLFPTNCSEGGLKYHIHTEWTWGDTQSDSAVDRILDECHYNYTGNHYDPWFACGSASSNADCEINGGCIPSSSVWGSSNDDETYICTPDDYDTVAYTCEVGDWSGKYGTLIPNETDNTVSRIDGSYWEVDRIILSPGQNVAALYSIVIHCNSGERAFCAPILRGNSNEVSKDLTDNQVVVVDFSDINDDFDNFTITFTKEGTELQWPSDQTSAILSYCKNYDMYLYGSYDLNTDDDDITAKKNCDTSLLGGIYDPTVQCINDSSSEYCDNNVRCPDTSATSVSYSCSSSDDYFGCAVGDIAGRVGTISLNSAGNGYLQVLDPKSPPLFTLADKTLVLKCVDDNSTATLQNICALTVQTNGTVVTLEPGTQSDDDAAMSIFSNLNVLISLYMILTVIFSNL